MRPAASKEDGEFQFGDDGGVPARGTLNRAEAEEGWTPTNQTMQSDTVEVVARDRYQRLERQIGGDRAWHAGDGGSLVALWLQRKREERVGALLFIERGMDNFVRLGRTVAREETEMLLRSETRFGDFSRGEDRSNIRARDAAIEELRAKRTGGSTRKRAARCD
ncbi:hypothetical protein GUJ93_ZPchr0011g27210 [Zizania palustris]|uniref:Uncharacterized protein n=1 Tax=Zizania palustris TaxID=103762 RepID=A0A8J6BSJ0_ZIZPA|nr:hypothetical protein GUJ93_ZPchr0011g27210 [Zizania palustris]